MSQLKWPTFSLSELDALEDDLAFESVNGDPEAIPSCLREDAHEALPDLVDPSPREVRSYTQAMFVCKS